MALVVVRSLVFGDTFAVADHVTAEEITLSMSFRLPRGSVVDVHFRGEADVQFLEGRPLELVARCEAVWWVCGETSSPAVSNQLRVVGWA